MELFLYNGLFNLLYISHYTVLVTLNSLSSVQFSLVAQSCPTLATPWIAAHQASLSITISQFTKILISFGGDQAFLVLGATVGSCYS